MQEAENEGDVAMTGPGLRFAKESPLGKLHKLCKINDNDEYMDGCAFI